jgi:hypothetical protein
MPFLGDPEQVAGDLAIGTILAANAPLIAAAAVILASHDPEDIIDTLQTTFGPFAESAKFLGDLINGNIGAETAAVGAPLVKGLILDPLGIEGGLGEADAGDALETINRAFGFGLQLPYAVAGVGSVAKLLFGHKAADAALEPLGHISEEIGLPFFLGSVMASIFERAVGAPLEEAVNVTHFPARLTAQQVMRLLRSHALEDGEADAALRKLGYKPELANILKKLDRSFLSFSQLQSAYLFGIIDIPTIEDHLTRAGFEDEDIAIMVSLITEHESTEGGSLLRSVAHAGYRDGHLTAGQFTDILTLANVPPASIQLELYAIDLQRSWTVTTLSVAQMKSAYIHGDLDRNTITMELVAKGYSANDAGIIITTWEQDQVKATSAVSVSRILAYLVGGVLTPTAAYDRLVAQGVSPADAGFLVANPSANGTTFQYVLSPNTVASAVKDEIITVDAAKDLLAGLSIDPEQANLLIQIAVHQQAKKKIPKAPAKFLTEAQYIAAFEAGLMNEPALVRSLVGLGYSETDAQLLVAIQYAKDVGEPPPDWTVIT